MNENKMMRNMVDSHAKYQLAFLIVGDRRIVENGEWKPDYLEKVNRAIDSGQYVDFASGKKVFFSWRTERGSFALEYIKWLATLE